MTCSAENSTNLKQVQKRNVQYTDFCNAFMLGNRDNTKKRLRMHSTKLVTVVATVMRVTFAVSLALLDTSAIEERTGGVLVQGRFCFLYDVGTVGLASFSFCSRGNLPLDSC